MKQKSHEINLAIYLKQREVLSFFPEFIGNYSCMKRKIWIHRREKAKYSCNYPLKVVLNALKWELSFQHLGYWVEYSRTSRISVIRSHWYSICSVQIGLIIEFKEVNEIDIYIAKSLMIYFSAVERKYFSIRNYLLWKVLREIPDGNCSCSYLHLILGTRLPRQW